MTLLRMAQRFGGCVGSNEEAWLTLLFLPVASPGLSCTKRWKKSGISSVGKAKCGASRAELKR
jgi:hypothetical protein